jgi:hypothetical protein
MLAAARAGDHRWGFAATATAVAQLLLTRQEHLTCLGTKTIYHTVFVEAKRRQMHVA